MFDWALNMSLIINEHESYILASFAFHIETSHFFCTAKQMAGFYMKRNTRLK